MPEIRVLIVDDEPAARRGIRQLAAAHPDLTIVGEAGDGRQALLALESFRPDLVFLDVQMPELDGMQVVRRFGVDRMPQVVFVTAYDEFAVQAFELRALDYLIKPATAARFGDALARARRHLGREQAADLSRRLSSLLDWSEATSPAPPDRLTVLTGRGKRLLDLDEIEWIGAQNYYAAVYAEGKKYLIRETVARLAASLDPSRFLRVHRKAIVNLAAVRELMPGPRGDSIVVLRSGSRIPVSRRRRTELLERIGSPVHPR